VAAAAAARSRLTTPPAAPEPLVTGTPALTTSLVTWSDSPAELAVSPALSRATGKLSLLAADCAACVELWADSDLWSDPVLKSGSGVLEGPPVFVSFPALFPRDPSCPSAELIETVWEAVSSSAGETETTEVGLMVALDSLWYNGAASTGVEAPVDSTEAEEKETHEEDVEEAEEGEADLERRSSDWVEEADESTESERLATIPESEEFLLAGVLEEKEGRLTERRELLPSGTVFWNLW